MAYPVPNRDGIDDRASALTLEIAEKIADILSATGMPSCYTFGLQFPDGCMHFRTAYSETADRPEFHEAAIGSLTSALDDDDGDD